MEWAGHNGGEVASKLAIESIIKYISKSRSKDIFKIITSSIIYANNVIYEKSKEDKNLSGMGTTLSFVYINENKAYMTNIGDSRIYLLNSGNIKQLSTDDTYVVKLVKSGAITKDEAIKHPNKNVLMKALGVDTKLDFTVSTINLYSGNTILICSDGLTTMLKDSEICDIISKSTNDRKRTTKRLIDKANKNGGIDNITVIIIDI